MVQAGGAATRPAGRVLSLDFSDDTALRELGAGRFEATITDRWWIVTGPNGGLLAALLLRATEAVVAERRPELAPRILTVQYLAGPQEGPVRLDAAIEREGRRVAFTTVTMTQGERTICQAKVTFAAALGDEFDVADQVMPAVPAPADCPQHDRRASYGNARTRWERRDVRLDEPGTIAGWLRLDPPVPVDAAVLALMCDNLPPSLRAHEPDPELAERLHTTTIELSVYFRRATLDLEPDAHCLTVLRSASAVDGLHQEEAEVWSPDGRLLATSRQLALVFRRPASSTSSSDS